MAERIKFGYGTSRIKPKFERLNLRAFGVKFDGRFLVFIFSRCWYWEVNFGANLKLNLLRSNLKRRAEFDSP
ncbi:hypothetical protein [Campylobacter showae]|uniref:Uncharacterized protein n=1 Tax=Campylobacter showae CSUNSWCD TaxID=1244083 RepID=M5ISA8_9BACT|nr:hypothetical protein [Campylobacter showae]EKU12321.1 hypothetical protein CSUNSWCD_261 [Campylobacter showae CSUNSWCD]